MSFAANVENAQMGAMDISARVGQAYPQIPDHEIRSGLLFMKDYSRAPAIDMSLAHSVIERDPQDKARLSRNKTHDDNPFYALSPSLGMKQMGPDFVNKRLPQAMSLASIPDASHSTAEPLKNSHARATRFQQRVDANPDIASTQIDSTQGNNADEARPSKSKMNYLLLGGAAAVILAMVSTN